MPEQPPAIASAAAAPRLVYARPGFLRRHSSAIGLLLVLLAGAVARVALSLRDGHLADVDLFLAWMRDLVEHGLAGFYSASPGCNYPPLHLLTLWGLGEGLARLDPDILQSTAARAWLRVPACLADVLIAILLYFEVRRLSGRRAAVGASALYFLNPVALYNSAYWGQVDSIHSFFVLGALAALNRNRPLFAGLAFGLALMQKLQSIAFAPLLLFDIYRWRRWGGLVWMTLGLVIAAGGVIAPFVPSGVWDTALERGYVRVVGQYDKLSYNAFNLWHALGNPSASDSGRPPALVRIAAGDEHSVAEGMHWLLHLTWRRIGVLLCALAMSLVLAFYSRRYTAESRALAAGLFGLAFFLLLTEMHERYAFTALAVLPIWAVGGVWRERAYVLLSAAMLLNLTVAQSVDEIGGEIAGLHLLLGAALVFAVLVPGAPRGPAAPDPAIERRIEVAPPPRSRLVALFRWVAFAALLAFAGVGGWLAYRYYTLEPPATPGTVYLSELTPLSVSQGYGKLARDCSVDGDVIHLADTFYLRGLGTHAPSSLVYEVPAGSARFQAIAGVNRAYRGRVKLEVLLDGKSVGASPVLTRDDPPMVLQVPLEGAKQIRLIARAVDGNKGDHVDWALARFVP